MLALIMLNVLLGAFMLMGVMTTRVGELRPSLLVTRTFYAFMCLIVVIHFMNAIALAQMWSLIQ